MKSSPENEKTSNLSEASLDALDDFLNRLNKGEELAPAQKEEIMEEKGVSPEEKEEVRGMMDFSENLYQFVQRTKPEIDQLAEEAKERGREQFLNEARKIVS